MKNFVFLLAGMGVLICLSACGSNIDCTAEYKPGPVMVTIDCVDDVHAKDEELGSAPIVIEYQHDGGTWQSCRDLYVIDTVDPFGQYDDPHDDIYDDGNIPLTAQLCGENRNLRATAECGDRPGGTFYVRARQASLSAGPMEFTGKLKKGNAGKCGYYTDKSLSYELSLDVEE